MGRSPDRADTRRKAYGELTGVGKRAGAVTADDVMSGACVMLSVFIKDPQFQGQTKELVSAHATKLVEQAVKDHFDHWLSATPEVSSTLLEDLRAGGGSSAASRRGQP